MQTVFQLQMTKVCIIRYVNKLTQSLYNTTVVIPDDFDEDSTRILCEELNEIAYKYSELGLQLLGTNSAVKKIENKVKDVKRYLGEMIAKWLANYYTGNQPFEDVLVAIRSKSVSEKALANTLETKWKEKGFCKSLHQ